MPSRVSHEFIRSHSLQLERLVRFLLHGPEEDPPRCWAGGGTDCNNKRCLGQFAHCQRCGARMSEWFHPNGANFRHCSIDSGWSSHAEYRRLLKELRP